MGILRTDGIRNRLLLFILGAVVAGTTFPLITEASTYWYEDYLRMIFHLENGRVDQAEALLDRSMEKMPFSEHKVRIVGNRFIDYFPYYYRAQIKMSRGDLEGAREDLAIEEALGAIKKNEKAYKQLQQLKMTLVIPPPQQRERQTDDSQD
jgi:hypothetical protein